MDRTTFRRPHQGKVCHGWCSDQQCSVQKRASNHCWPKVANSGTLRKNHNVPRAYDNSLYRKRNQIERLFAKIKQRRRLATRYDKTAHGVMAFLQSAA